MYAVYLYSYVRVQMYGGLLLCVVMMNAGCVGVCGVCLQCLPHCSEPWVGVHSKASIHNQCCLYNMCQCCVCVCVSVCGDTFGANLSND